MEKIPTVIGVNGPPGIGKSWFINKIAKVLTRPGVDLKIICPRDFIWEETKEEYRWTEGLDQFKSYLFPDGRTGREHMIELAERRRQEDRHYWAKKFLESRKFRAADIVLNDSVAFPEEHDFLLSHISNFITVVIAPTEYSIGSFYPDNYRRCVAPVGGFRATNSSKALELFKARLQNAQSPTSTEDSIWRTLTVDRPLVQQ